MPLHLQKKVSKALVKPKKSLHPKYEDMILKAISHFHTRGGSSVSAISKYIISNYDVPKEHLKTQLRLGLKRAIEKNLLQKIKASYKISDGAKVKLNKDLKLKDKKDNNDKKENVKSKISKVPKPTPAKKKIASGVATPKKPGRKPSSDPAKKDVSKVKRGPKSNIKKKSQLSKKKPNKPVSKANSKPAPSTSRQGTRTRSKI